MDHNESFADLGAEKGVKPSVVKRPKFKKPPLPNTLFSTTPKRNVETEKVQEVPSFFSTASSSDEFLEAPSAVKKPATAPRKPLKIPPKLQSANVKNKSVVAQAQLPMRNKRLNSSESMAAAAQGSAKKLPHPPRRDVEELKMQLESIKASSILLEDARQLIYQALLKGAAIQKLANVVQTLYAHKAHFRFAFDRLAAVLPKRLTMGVDVEKALADSINRRGWEAHLQRMRQEQLTLLSENRLLLQKIEELRSESSPLPSSWNTTSREPFLFCIGLHYVTAFALRRQRAKAFTLWRTYAVHLSSLDASTLSANRNLFPCVKALERYARRSSSVTIFCSFLCVTPALRIVLLLNIQAAFYRLIMLSARDPNSKAVSFHDKRRITRSALGPDTPDYPHRFSPSAPMRYHHTYMLQHIPPPPLTDASPLIGSQCGQHWTPREHTGSMRYRPSPPVDPSWSQHLATIRPWRNDFFPVPYANDGRHMKLTRRTLAAALSSLHKEPGGAAERHAYDIHPPSSLQARTLSETSYETLLEELLTRLSRRSEFYDSTV